MKKLPILFLCGSSGSGKDAVAKIIKRQLDGVVTIAHADPIKEFGKKVFKMSNEQLFGPSELRNTPIPGFNDFVYNFNVRETDYEVRSFLNKYFDFPELKKLYLTTDCDGNPEIDDKFNLQLDFRNWVDSLRNKAIEDGSLTCRTVLQSFGTEFGRYVYENVWSIAAVNSAKKLLSSGKADFVVITDTRFRNEIINAKSNGAPVWLIDRPNNPSTTNTAGIHGHQSETELAKIPHWWYDVVITNDKSLADLEDKVNVALKSLFTEP